MRSPEYYPVDLTGLVVDIPPEKLGPDTWSWVQNAIFRDQSAERVGGYSIWADLVPVGETPAYILAVPTSVIDYWIYCTDVGIYVTDGITNFDITPAAGITDTGLGKWTGGLLNGIPFLNNTSDIPVYWPLQTGLVCEPLPGWDPLVRCKALRAAQYHLIALNITENSVNFPDVFNWSDSADPGTIPQSWTAEPGNEAGSSSLSASVGEIIDGGKLRDEFIIYKQNSTYQLTYVAGQYVFNARSLFVTSGIQANNCYAEWQGYHYVLTDNDIIRHDGNQIESLATWKVKRYLNETINPETRELCCLVADGSNDSIWVAYPVATATTLDAAFVINARTLDFGVRYLPNVSFIAAGVIPEYGESTAWDDDAQAWDDDITIWNQATFSDTAPQLMMTGAVTQKLYSVDTSDTNDGADVECMLERTGLFIQKQGVNEIFMTQLWPSFTGRAGDIVSIRCGGQQHFNEPIEWNVAQDFIIGSDDFIDVKVNKRYLAIRVSSVGGQVWQLHDFVFAGTGQGLY